MFQGVREFLNSDKGRYAAWAILVIGIVFGGWVSYQSLADEAGADEARQRTFIDAKTGTPYRVSIDESFTIPAMAPSGGKTGYPAELCAWTKDGQLKDDPTPVLLNKYAGKRGPTFCPDCGRLVVERNPVYRPGITPLPPPPPTQAEYRKKSVVSDEQ